MDKKSMLRLSPNEVDYVIKTQTDKYRIFRIQQVREQSREHAINIRTAVKEEEQRQKVLIKKKLENQWLGTHKEKLSKLKEEYNRCISDVGQAHKRAVRQVETVAMMKEKVSERNALANQRGRVAMQSIENRKVPSEKECVLKRRQGVLIAEKFRAQKVASRPLPKKFIPEKSKPSILKKVLLKEAGTFTTSLYVPKSTMITKETASSNQNAKQAASEQRKKLAQIKENNRVSEAEKQTMIARRANKALKREQVKHMYAGAMKQLADVDESDILQQMDSLQIDDTGRNYSISDGSKQTYMEKKVTILLDEMQSNEIQHIEVNENLQRNMHEATTLSSVRAAQTAQAISHGSLDRSKHLKETIHVKTLAVTAHKYVTRVGSIGSPLLTPTEGHHTNREGSSCSTVTNSSLRYSLSNDVDERQDSAGACNSNSEFSSPKEGANIERLNHLSDENLKECSFNSKNAHRYEEYMPINKSTALTADKECREMKTRLQLMLDEHSQDSSDSTKYRNFSPCDQTNIWSNMEQIHLNRKKIRGMLDVVDQKLIKEPSRQKPRVYVTPTKIYKEDIKDEGSNQKPINKRTKFEQQKQLVVKHYLHRLMEMKRRGMEVPLAPVEGSPIAFDTLSPMSDGNDSSGRFNTDSKASSISATEGFSIDSSSMEKSPSSFYYSEQPLTESPSTMKIPSMSQDSSRVTSTDSHLSTSSSSPQYSSESNVGSTPPTKYCQNKYFDTDKIPVRDSNSQELISSPSVRSDESISRYMGNATSQNPVDQQRIQEIHSRLDDLKHLRLQLLAQEELIDNTHLPILTNQRSILDSSFSPNCRPNSSVLNNDVATTLMSQESEFSISTPENNHREWLYEEKCIGDRSKLANETGIIPHNAISSLRNVSELLNSPTIADVVKSSCRESSDSSSIPDVEAFFRKQGFPMDKVTTILDKDSCRSSN